MIKLTKKQLIVGSLIALVILVAGLTTGLWATHTAKTRYTAQVATYRAHIKETLQSFDQQFADVQENTTNDNILTVLDKVDVELTQLLTAAPDEPKILGISIAPEQAKNDSQATRQWLFSLKQAVDESREFITYKSAILTILKEVLNQKGSNAEEQQALTNLWRQAHSKLTAVQAPPKASDFHTELNKTVESISATISSLPELYAKKDYAGFIAKQKELDSKITALSALHDRFIELNKAYDEAIARPLQAFK